MENIEQHLLEEYDVRLTRSIDDDDEDGYLDMKLTELILEYGQEQRKEGYKKGFEDGEADGQDS